MKRTQIYFTEKQLKFFKKESKKIQITSSSLIRRVLDSYIEKNEKREEK